MRVFVTGIAGFLGSHLAERLAALGHEVAGVDNLIGGDLDNVPAGVEFVEADCCDREILLAMLKRGWDVVYHCAATPHEGVSVFSPHFVAARNIFDASVAVFSAAIGAGVRRIIYCSSMARYGTNEVPFREKFRPKPQDPYGIAKVAAEDVLRTLSLVHGTEFVIAVPHNIIGPRQKFDDPFRNVASIWINLMLQGRRPVIYGDGEQRRCFSFVGECVDCLVKMADAPVAGEVINIGPDAEPVTINRVCALLMELLEFEGDPIYLPGRPQEVKDAICSADKARLLLGYEPKMSLRDGLLSMIEHIRARGPREFKYHLPLEIASEKTPATWRERLF